MIAEQGELFPEFDAKRGKKFPYIKQEFALGKRVVVSISWENFIFTIIVLIMLIAVFFSLGVEKGKRLAVKTPFKPYTIQVMAAKASDEAREEAAQFAAMGYKTFVVSSGAWYHVCIGRYSTPNEAERDLAALKSKYPNAYMRKLSN